MIPFRMSCDKLRGNKRHPNETFANYRHRLDIEHKFLSAYLRGRLFWHSESQGAFVRSE